ncbi:MAG: hypothetical protein IKL75_01355, partial [Bacteroidaceae bacterium]|nr:hypothetical protein [Bacteroidaceae bacterium]
MIKRRLFLSMALATLLFSCSTGKVATVSAVMTADTEIDYNSHFTGKTMRYDFHHAGNSTHEEYHFDRVIREGDWAGSTVSLINPFDYGEQMF